MTNLEGTFGTYKGQEVGVAKQKGSRLYMANGTSKYVVGHAKDYTPHAPLEVAEAPQIEGGIVVKGHVGTWYVIDRMTKHGQTYKLLESEVYGDEAPCLIVTEKTNKLVLEDVWNGFDDLIEAKEWY